MRTMDHVPAQVADRQPQLVLVHVDGSDDPRLGTETVEPLAAGIGATQRRSIRQASLDELVDGLLDEVLGQAQRRAQLIDSLCPVVAQPKEDARVGGWCEGGPGEDAIRHGFWCS